MGSVQGIFFTLGIIFLFATIAYFSYEYLFNLSNIAKTVVLICLVIVFFFVGDMLEGQNI